MKKEESRCEVVEASLRSFGLARMTNLAVSIFNFQFSLSGTLAFDRRSLIIK